MLNAGQKYCRMLEWEHSAMLSTFNKLPFAIKKLSIFEWPFFTGFTGCSLHHIYSKLVSGHLKFGHFQDSRQKTKWSTLLEIEHVHATVFKLWKQTSQKWMFTLLCIISNLTLCSARTQAPRLYFFHAQLTMLNSVEQEIYPAHKCQNANNCWHFNIH